MMTYNRFAVTEKLAANQNGPSTRKSPEFVVYLVDLDPVRLDTTGSEVTKHLAEMISCDLTAHGVRSSQNNVFFTYKLDPANMAYASAAGRIAAEFDTVAVPADPAFYRGISADFVGHGQLLGATDETIRRWCSNGVQALVTIVPRRDQIRIVGQRIQSQSIFPVRILVPDDSPAIYSVTSQLL